MEQNDRIFLLKIGNAKGLKNRFEKPTLCLVLYVMILNYEY